MHQDVFNVAGMRTLAGAPEGLGLGTSCEHEDAEVRARRRKQREGSVKSQGFGPGH